MSTRAQILAEIAAQFPDNTTGLITPAKLRQVCEDLANSSTIPETDGTIAAAVSAHNVATAHGGVGRGITALSDISAAGNVAATLIAGDSSRVFTANVAAGSGAYTAVIYLPSDNATAASVATVVLTLAATTNPTVELRSLTASGALLGTTLGTGDARVVVYTCRYNGSGWELSGKMPANVTAAESGLALRRRTLSGNLTLGYHDKSDQCIVPDADRDVTLPAESTTAWAFMLGHAGASYNLTIKRAGGTTVGVLIPGSAAAAAWDGTGFKIC